MLDRDPLLNITDLRAGLTGTAKQSVKKKRGQTSRPLPPEVDIILSAKMIYPIEPMAIGI